MADITQLVTNNDEVPFIEFVEKLKEEMPHEEKKLMGLLKRFADFGEIRDKNKFRSEIPPTYAFKTKKARLFCFFLPNAPKKTVVLLNGYIKKGNKLSASDGKTAIKLYEQFRKNNE